MECDVRRVEHMAANDEKKWLWKRGMCQLWPHKWNRASWHGMKSFGGSLTVLRTGADGVRRLQQHVCCDGSFKAVFGLFAACG